MASASASAVSAGRGGSSIRSNRITMAVTWALSARPLPVTAAFTSLGVCSVTGRPRRAAHTMATAPAWAVPITVRTLCWLNTRSTATASGSYSASHRSISTSSASSRAAMSALAGVRITSAAARAGGLPATPSITPIPHRVRPGSTPSTRMRHHPAGTNMCSEPTLPADGRPGSQPARCVAIGGSRGSSPWANTAGLARSCRRRRAGFASSGALGLQLLHDLVGDRVVGVDVLHVVGVLEGLDQAEQAFGLILIEGDLNRGQERHFGRLVLNPGVGHRAPHRDQVVWLGGHLEGVAEVLDVLGAGVKYRREHVVLGDAVALVDQDHALAVEHIRHRARVGHGAAVAGQRRAHIGGGPVPVVGQALDQDGDPAGRVTLVGDRLVLGAAGLKARAAADGAIDVLVRHRILLRLLHGVVQGGIAGRVGAAGPRRHLNILDQLGEELAAPGVNGRLLVLGRRPFGMATHVRSLTMSTKCRWTRRSPVNSGWKEVASSGPCRRS